MFNFHIQVWICVQQKNETKPYKSILYLDALIFNDFRYLCIYLEIFNLFAVRAINFSNKFEHKANWYFFLGVYTTIH